VALDTADGTERWRVSLASEEGVFLRTRPLVTERSVIVTTEKPGLDEPANTFAVDRRNGEVRWQREQPGNIGYDAVAAGGRLYVPVLWDFTLDRERRDTSGTGQLSRVSQQRVRQHRTRALSGSKRQEKW